MPEEMKKPICPECKSALITELANMKRCQQCGHQFDLDKHSIASRAQKSRAAGVGWPKRS